MTADARISTAMPSHPKVRKLLRRLGHGAGWSWVCLILWTAANRPNGSLAGLNDEDLEIACDWAGTAGDFIPALRDLRLLDGPEGESSLHDWSEHNPWAAEHGARVDAARKAAKARWDAERMRTASETDAEGNAERIASDAGRIDPQCPQPNPTQPNLTALEAIASVPAAREARLAVVTEDAAAAYNASLAKPVGRLAAVHLVNDTRRKQVKRSLGIAREICLREYQAPQITRKFWDDYFAECAKDPFKSGRRAGGKGHEGWAPDFEYLTRPDVMTSVFDKAMSEAS